MNILVAPNEFANFTIKEKIMARYIYVRVSTEAQSHERQLFRMTEYFNRMGMNMEDVEIVSEKITSHTDFKERKLYPVLQKAKEGDIIYVCQLDRLGRTMVDILELVDYAVKKGVILLTIDNGYQLENKTSMGKLYVGMVSAMAEAEREVRAERCQAGIDAAKEEIKKNGHRITKRGTVQTHWGNRKGCDDTKRIMSIARAESIRAKQDAVISWKTNSVAYQWAITQIKKGKTRKTVVSEFNELHAQQPTVYCTRQGKPLSEAVLSKWIAMSNPIAI